MQAACLLVLYIEKPFKHWSMLRYGCRYGIQARMRGAVHVQHVRYGYSLSCRMTRHTAEWMVVYGICVRGMDTYPW